MSRKKSRLTVKTLPLLRDDLSDYVGEPGTIEQLKAAYPGYEPRTVNLEDAHMWWVSPDMTKLVHAAAPSFPADVMPADVIPASKGVLIWDGGLGWRINRITDDGDYWHTELAEITGVVWEIGAGGLGIMPLVKIGGTPFGVHYAGSTGQSDNDKQLVGAALATSWVLATQPTVGTTRPFAAELRRATHRHRPSPMTVTVATLREIARPTDTEPSLDTAREGRSLSVRFLVRGHWRSQPCGPARKQRKPVWVAPYVKGPVGAPFQETDLIKVWRR